SLPARPRTARAPCFGAHKGSRRFPIIWKCCRARIPARSAGAASVANRCPRSGLSGDTTRRCGLRTRTPSCKPCWLRCRRRRRTRHGFARSIPEQCRQQPNDGALIRTKSENCCQLARSPRLTAGLDKIMPFVGGMVGIERTVVPLIGSEEFHLASNTLIVVSGHLADV